MKLFLMKSWVILRRFQRGTHLSEASLEQVAPHIEAMMRRADPAAEWNERANWMIDVAAWLRREPLVAEDDDEESNAPTPRNLRTRFLLDWLDEHRDVKRTVQATLQKTLREATGPELFTATGLPREAAFFSELTERSLRHVLPRPPANRDLSALFTAMFPHPADADWLLGLDAELLSRLWKLCGDAGISHMYRKQIDEALLYLVTLVIAAGISPEFQHRLGPRLPLMATPFMSLRREIEKLLVLPVIDDAALRSVRMLIAVCQAQTDKIYAHLDEYGVSVGLVYTVERMRAQLSRLGRLVDLRAAPGDGRTLSQVQALLVDLIAAHHQRTSIRGLVRRSFSLLARKMVERNADHGEQYIARDREEYRAMLRAACRGGIITAVTVVAKFVLSGFGMARFFEGLFASLNYAISFLTISAVGGVLATKQPSVTAPALAAKMGELDTVDGLRALLSEIALLLRSQAAAVFGNLIAVVPTMLAIGLLVGWMTGGPILTAAKAQATLQDLSIIGPTPFFAAFTGVLLWIASLGAGFADNWFALRCLRDALTHHRRLNHALGARRAQRLAAWLDCNIGPIIGNVLLGVLLGMTPVVASFFGLPLDVRHVTLSTGTLTAAAASLGWPVLAGREFWLAAGGIVLIGLLNVGVAFSCALALSLRAREVPARIRRLVFRAVLRRLSASPLWFLFPERQAGAATDTVAEESQMRSRERRSET